MCAQRVVVFVDYQNCYRGARRAFFDHENDLPSLGQVFPRRLGLKLKNHAAGDRELEQVRVYRGMPSNKHDRTGHAAADRQVALWEQQQLVKAITRPINYRDPANPKEKGIDVRIAIDIVMMAMRDSYDIAVLMSDDTDLLPALEALVEMRGTAAIEVATWAPDNGTPATPLRVPGHGHLIHRLDRRDYGHVEDATDYTQRRRRR